MTVLETDLGPALGGRRPPPDDGEALRRTAARLEAAARSCADGGRGLRRASAALSRSWRGDAGPSARAEIGDLAGAADQADEALGRAADVLRRCAAQLDEAQATWARAAVLDRARTRADVPTSVRQQVVWLADEAHLQASLASARACEQLVELSEAARRTVEPPRRPLTAADQARGFGRGLVDAVWGSVVTVARLSTGGFVVDREAWLEQVRALLDGAAYAAGHPDEAVLATVGWDALEEGRYGESAGGLVPDLVGGVFTGGALPVTRRAADVADDLTELAEDVDDLGRVHDRPIGPLPSPEAGGPVEPRPGAVMTERYPTAINDLSEERRTHILDGDPPGMGGGRGGGHRPGRGKPRKSEFPPSWTDDDIIRRVMETARHPYRTADQLDQDRTTMVATGHHEGVHFEVVVDPEGNVVTAYPKSGPGVVHNPPRSRRP